MTATLAGLAFAGAATEYVVLGFAFVLGILTAFALPAQQALIASLVERDDLPSAVALNSMTYNLARAVGPSLAAIVITRSASRRVRRQLDLYVPLAVAV